MDSPPVIGSPAAAGPGVAPWRSGLMLLLLLSSPPLLGLLGKSQGGPAADAAVLPETVAGLLTVSAVNLGIFLAAGFVIGVLGRPTAGELFLRGRQGWRTWALGAGYSVLLRVALAVLAAAVILAMSAVLRLQGQPLDSLARLRPEIERVIAPAALRDPLYLLLTVTLVSFGVAGLREELWRAAALAALFRFRPPARDSRLGQAGAAALTAAVFGLGHLPQGWGGVALTAALGLGLGLILLGHRSLWIAVLAHGFFDATSFLLLRWASDQGLLNPGPGVPVPAPP